MFVFYYNLKECIFLSGASIISVLYSYDPYSFEKRPDIQS